MTTSEILGKLPALRVLVIGDVMVDHYVWGEVNRISPEAPVPVVQVLRESYTAGGAANVALNLAALTARPELVGVVGRDESADRLKTLLESHGIDCARWVALPEVRTIVKTRVIARTQQLCRIDHEGPRAAYAPTRDPAFEARMEAALADTDAVIISDYAKGVVSQELVSRVIARADARGVLTAIDPKPARHLEFYGIGLVTPNRHEALELAGLPEPGVGESYPLDEVCRLIHERFGPRLLVITLGADGMAVCRNGKVECLMPTVAREVFDVSGAGDTVIASLASALAAGADPVSAAKFANLAAGVVVSKMGTATVTPEELRAAE